jgi:uncharacterized radical SAM superfamily Fe-S cluster-containing enzyme
LVMTVTHENVHDCHTTLTRSLTDDNVPWVVFQPEFLSGRNDRSKLNEAPVSVSDIIRNLHHTGVMDEKSWIPLPCSDPNCGTVGFLVRIGTSWRPVSEIVDLSEFTPLIENRMNFSVEDSISNCGCDDYDLQTYLHRYGLSKHDIKMVFLKPFMDERTWDDDRIASCCTHIIGRDGKLDSFCRYYANQ